VCSVENTRWPGLGRQQRRLDGFEVAHFADEDDVGVLTQRAAQRQRERRRVDADFALVDDRLVVAVQVLDRVFDRHHVRAARGVDLVDHRRQRGALARTGGAGDEHESALLGGDPLQHFRQRQLRDRRDLHRNDAEDQPDRAALLEGVAAESTEPAML
jgi:hypothetical protein